VCKQMCLLRKSTVSSTVPFIVVCSVLCVDYCVTLRVMQVHCNTYVYTVKKISPSEAKFPCDTILVEL
jgi:hypothetical protein